MENIVRHLGNLHLSQKSVISLAKTEPEYILDMAAQNTSDENSLVGATSSNYCVRLFRKSTLTSTSSIKVHNNVVTGLTFGKEDPNLMFTSSLDKTVKCWDLRCNPGSEAQIFRGECNTGFSSIDISCDDQLLCSGTDIDKDKDVYMFFWDRRKSTYLGSYSESFENELTQVCFHPDKRHHVASGSTDGLVCVFDLNETDEDDALISTLNTQSFVSRIGWCGDEYYNIYCITDVDTYHIWQAFEGDVIKETLELKQKLKNEDSIDYLIDVIPTDSKHILAAGTKGGDVKLIDVSEKRPDVILTLCKGHSQIVRCLYYNYNNGSLITGSEDSLLCLWSSEPILQSTTSDHKGKVKSKRIPNRKTEPYGR